MNNWSLDALYTGYNEVFVKDMELVKQKVAAYQELGNNLSSSNSLDTLKTYLNTLSDLNTHMRKLGSYIQLNLSTNTSDSVSNNYLGQLSLIYSQFAKPAAQFSNWLSKNKDNVVKWAKEDEYIKEHEFTLNEILTRNSYQLSDDAEVIVSTMEINASSAWSKLQSFITSKSSNTLNEEQLTLTELRNLAYDKDPVVRKNAYEKELELYEGIKDAVSFSLNSIKGEVVQISKLRGYSSVMDKTLQDSRMSKESLDAMFTAIDEYLPVFRKYLKHKGTLLNHKNGLPWYDLFAPMGNADKTYTVDEAKKMIVDSFSDYSPALGQLAVTAFADNWVDFLPKQGKVGGAFCSNLPFIKQSRVLTNFGGSIGDIITLAHELGHAYHGYRIQDCAPLNTSYSMPVAETASTFCENIVLNTVLKSASKEEKILLIENSLQDLTQIIVDIYSRYQFENDVVNRRESEFLFADELCNSMIKAQKATYGNGLDQSVLHPYMWICKSHYYSAGRNFYNFPYAFGGLFSLGLFAQYQNENKAFIGKYDNLLTATTTSSCEDVAKLANIDVTTPEFWKSSLQSIAERIELFIDLTK